jgi:hypothetical protein
VNVYRRGNAINLKSTFSVRDPVTDVVTPADPTTVTFTIVGPDAVTVGPFEYPGSPNVTKESTGVYVCALSPLLPTGIYHYEAVGAGAVAARDENDFQVTDSAVETPDPPDQAVEGPCYPWIDGCDVAACARVDYGQNPYVFDTVAAAASAVLYEISGRKYPGVCTWTVRPTNNQCGCWGGPASLGFYPFWWTGTPWGAGFGGWWWWNERGDKLGCSPMSRVRLQGYPVARVTEVKIDGVVLPELDTHGNPNYRLDGRRWLTRMNDPVVAPASPRFWPGCQDMSLDDDQPGTFSITYDWGQDVPAIGVGAAVELANQLWLACGGNECVLPAGVTRVTRQGIEIERGLLANWADPTKPTGLVQLDTFLMAYNNGNRGGRRSAMWSPDQQQFAQRMG